MADDAPRLEGVQNFRDFGGHVTADGRHVVRRRLFRSGHFAQPSDADQAILNALNIELVADLRRTSERAREPAAWRGNGDIRLIIHDDPPEDAAPLHLAFLKSATITPETVTAFVSDSYRTLPYQPRNLWLSATFLSALSELNPSAGAIIHCTHGKDRTGILVALTLHALGVDRDTILDDFERSNGAIDLATRLPIEHERICSALDIAPPIEAIAPMIRVSRNYLAAAFDEMQRRDGSVDGYLRWLGVDETMKDRLRAALLV